MSEEEKPTDQPQGADDLTLHVASLWASVLPSLQTKVRASLGHKSDDVDKSQKLEVLLGKIVKASGFPDQDDLFSDQFAESFQKHLENLRETCLEDSISSGQEEKKAEEKLLQSLKETQANSISNNTRMEKILRSFANQSGLVLPLELSLADLNRLEAHLTSKLKSEEELRTGWEQAKLMFGGPTLLQGQTAEGSLQTNSREATKDHDDPLPAALQSMPMRQILTAVRNGNSKLESNRVSSGHENQPKTPYLTKQLSKFPSEPDQHVATGKLTCSCGFEANHATNLRAHIAQKTTEWKFHCETCNYYFFYNSNLERHYERNVLCRKANNANISKSLAPRRQKRSLVSPTKSTPSKRQKSSFHGDHEAQLSAADLRQKLLSNPQDWKFTCNEENCNLRFAYLYDLKIHLVAEHRIENPYKDSIGCSFCGNMFTHRADLIAHQRSFRYMCGNQHSNEPEMSLAEVQDKMEGAMESLPDSMITRAVPLSSAETCTIEALLEIARGEVTQPA